MLLSNARAGARSGALIGGFFAAAALGVGAIRALILRLAGTELRVGLNDIRVLAFYVGALVLAGALVGAVHSSLRNRAGTAVAFAVAGALVMNGIAVVLDWQSYDWVIGLAMGFFGALLGLAAGYGMAKAR